MMRKLAAVWLACLFLSACSAGRQAAPSSVPSTPIVRAALAEEEPAPAQQPVKPQEPQTPQNPLSKSLKTPAPAKEQAPEEVTIFLQSAGTDLNAQADTPEQTTKAEDLIAQARKQQTLKEPAKDKVSFEDEDIIPLEGRRLSPMAYEPVTLDDTHAPWSGEELKYGVYYSFIKAGTAYIKNRGLTTVNGRKAYLLQTTAFSAAVIDAFFKVRDVNYSWLDAENFYSLGYLQSVREGSYKRDEWLIFDYPRRLFYGELQKKEAPRMISGELSMQVLDMLSSLYFVRAQKLEPGKDIIFDIINRERQYPLVVKVLGKETVKTNAGKFNCIVVEPQFRGEGIFVSKGKSLKVWLTDDEYKMPVKMKTEVFIGSVSAELLEYKRN